MADLALTDSQPLYLITDGGRLRNDGALFRKLAAALRGGQGRLAYVQLREQIERPGYDPAEDEEVKRLALELIPLCHSFGAGLIISHRLDLAQDVRADGVHLPGTALKKLPEVRELLGRERVLGYSAHAADEAIEAFSGGASYVLFGPVFAPLSKESSASSLGPAAVEQIPLQLRTHVFALGGVSAQNAYACREAGFGGVASITSVLGAEDPCLAVGELLTAWDGKTWMEKTER